MFTFDAPQPLLPDLIGLHGRWQINKPALIFEDTTLTWPVLSDSVDTFARALVSAGVNKGDRVLVVMDNCAEMVVALFGIMRAGAVSVPINLTVSKDSMQAMADDAEIVAVVTTYGQRSRVDEILPYLKQTPTIQITTGDANQDWRTWQAFFNDADAHIELPPISGNDVMNIIYSSGTTGQPKGILHTHQGRRDWASDLAIALRYHAGSRTLVTIGLYSNISWVSMLCTFVAGGTLVVTPRFDANDTLDDIERHRITNLSMVPIQYQRLLTAHHARRRDISSLSAVMSCGSPLPAALKRELFAALPCGVIELYGLTEGIITTLQPEDAEGRWSSVGRPLSGTDIKLLDENNIEVSIGEPGEIVSRGRITMPCYLNREQATREACWSDSNGYRWLRSGDIGVLDKDGFLSIVDRKKDMILSGGQNIYPQDIEAVLIDHPLVDEAAVIPAKSKRWGETPVALVVALDKNCDAASLMAWCNGRVGRHQRIADLILINEIPRNPNGKILKRTLRNQYQHLHYD